MQMRNQCKQLQCFYFIFFTHLLIQQLEGQLCLWRRPSAPRQLTHHVTRWWIHQLTCETDEFWISGWGFSGQQSLKPTTDIMSCLYFWPGLLLQLHMSISALKRLNQFSLKRQCKWRLCCHVMKPKLSLTRHLRLGRRRFSPR